MIEFVSYLLKLGMVAIFVSVVAAIYITWKEEKTWSKMSKKNQEQLKKKIGRSNG